MIIMSSRNYSRPVLVKKKKRINISRINFNFYENKPDKVIRNCKKLDF